MLKITNDNTIKYNDKILQFIYKAFLYRSLIFSNKKLIPCKNKMTSYFYHLEYGQFFK